VSKSILLVEDEVNDVYFMKRAFKEAGILHSVHVAENGQEAMDYLGGEGRHADRGQFPLPCLILLDLKLPRVEGLEVLKWIREQPGLRNIIVVVLTSSRMESDLAKAYRYGANAYLVKPSTPPDLLKMVIVIKQFWLELNSAPSLAKPAQPGLDLPVDEDAAKCQAVSETPRDKFTLCLSGSSGPACRMKITHRGADASDRPDPKWNSWIRITSAWLNSYSPHEFFLAVTWVLRARPYERRGPCQP